MRVAPPSRSLRPCTTPRSAPGCRDGDASALAARVDSLACIDAARHTPAVTATVPTQNWIVRKPPVRAKGGVVVSQNLAAAQIGARILAEGGNAIDAAVATGFALAALEPWNSGLGGIGFMVVWLARTKQAHVVDFGPVSPRRLDPSAYPLTTGTGGDLFGWPRVDGRPQRDGPAVDCRTRPGRRSRPCTREIRQAVVERRPGTGDRTGRARPAGRLVHDAAGRDVGARARAIPDHRAGLAAGRFPPATPSGAALARLRIPRLADTLRRIAGAGRRDVYEGDVARRIVGDVEKLGGTLRADDMADYKARLVDPLAFTYRGTSLLTAGGLTAGPTLAHALATLARRNSDRRPVRRPTWPMPMR